MSKVQVYVHGASHFGENRHFPRLLQEALEAGGSKVSENFEIALVKGVSGGRLSEERLGEILSGMETCKRANIKSLHVVQLGGNNLRRARNMGDECRVLVSRFERLADAATENCRLAIIGLVPSPQTKNGIRFHFTTVDLHLKEIAKSKSFVFFLDLKWRFCHAMKEPKMEFFNGYRDVHLNAEGTALLAKSIVDMWVHTYTFNPKKKNQP